MADEIVGLPKLKVDDLKKELQKRGLKTKGTKSELQERLLEFLKNDVSNGTDTNEEQQATEITDLGNSTEEDDLESPTKKEAEEPLLLKTDDSISQKTDSDTEKSTVDVDLPSTKPEQPVVKIGLNSPAEERRLQRGKRFGEITNETDKKKLRAERFKTGDSEVIVKGKTVTGNELESMKKRVERFGVISPAMDKLNENDRKTKRQERFGMTTSVSTTSNKSSQDAAKQKRAERFGLG